MDGRNYRDSANTDANNYVQARGLRVNRRRRPALYGGTTLAYITHLLVFAYCLVVWLPGCQTYSGITPKEKAMTLTLNTPENYTANTVGTSDMAVGYLSETALVGLYYDTTLGSLRAVVFTVSGQTTISAGTPASIAGAKNTSFAIAGLSATKAIAVYQDSVSGDIIGRILTISGSSISNVGATNILDTDGGVSGGSGSIAVAGLGAGAAITAYRDENDSNKGKGRALDISGDTITPGSETTIINNAVFNVSLVTIKDSSSQAIFTCLDNGTTPANRPSAHVLTKSGSTLSAGSQALLEATATPTGHVGIASMSASVAVATYENNGGTVQGQVLGISGTSITTNTSAEIDSTAINANVMAGRIGANTAIGVYRNTSNQTYALEVLVSGTSVSGGTPLLVSATVGEQSDAYTTASPYTLVMYGDDAVIVTSSEAEPDVSDSGIYAIGAALDNETDGSIIWVTVWKDDGNMYAQQWDADALTVNFEIPLGAATLAQVQERSTVAYPYLGNTNDVWIFGRMSNPAYLTSGTVWIIRSSTGGASGTWSVAPSGPYAGGFEDADVLDSLHVTPDLSGLGDRFFSGVRRRGGNAPEFWRGLNGMTFVSAIPLPTGTGVNWRGMHVNRQYEVSLGSNMLGTGSSRVLSAASPWTSWRDITGMAGPTPFPSGTVGVLRYF